jgi:hypothetical protein
MVELQEHVHTGPRVGSMCYDSVSVAFQLVEAIAVYAGEERGAALLLRYT